MRFNNRAMALAGIPDLPEEAFKHNGDRKIKPQGGGGGGPTSSTSYQTNIPEYMEPYVHRMMGATEGQIYQPDGGFRPYQSYSEYDKKRGGSGETVAGMTPMQAGAMQNLQGYQLPQQGQYGSQMALGAGLGSMGAGQQYAQQATNPMATAAYMSPYMANAVAPQMREAARQSAMMGQENQAKAVQQGAFGGARTGIIEAERQRNLAQQQADIYGKGTQTAFEQARQAQQFGADLGLKGMGQGLQSAQALGELGQQQYGQQMGVLGKQLEVGREQQAYEQNRLNQVIQDYATSQQYPFMQLGMLSNMIRGQPMQAVTTQSYQAQPNFLQQGIGALGMVNSMQGNKKEGGIIKMAGGGIASGLNDYELRGMSKRLGDGQLGKKVNDPTTDPDTKDILGGEMSRRSQTRKAAGVGMASGGILAFAKGSEEAIDTIDSPFAKDEKDAPVESKFIDATAKKEVKKAEKKPVTKATPKEPTGQSADYKQMERDIGSALADRQKITPQEQTLRDALDQETKRTPQSYLEEQQAMLKAAGADPQFFEKARTPLTKRMAELGSNAENKKRIREAQAWATFGSTPGPMLSVALKSYSAYLEQSITDEDDLAKAQAELNKAMFDIDKSEYLEKAGFAKDAVKAKYDGFTRVTDLSYKVATLTENRNKDILDTREKMVTQANRSQTEKENARVNAAARVGSGGGSEKLETTRNAKIAAAYEKEYGGLIDQRNRIMSAMNTAKDESKKEQYQTQLDKIQAQLSAGRKEIEARFDKEEGAAAPKEEARPAGLPADAKKSPIDGQWYAPDPNRPGKYLKYS
jgi:hypothetical protein